MVRNLVVLCDGTDNQMTGHESNVLRLYQLLARDSQQTVYYDSGVGTTPTADRVTPWAIRFRKKLDAAVGLSIRHHFLKAYRFLLNHYEPGDRIWLFGFSRGAYTARAVAGAHRAPARRPADAGAAAHGGRRRREERHRRRRGRRGGLRSG